MKKNIINFLKFLVFLSIGLIILYLVFNNQNQAFQEQCRIDGVSPEDCSLIGKIISDFKSVNYWWILAALVAFTISNISRAIRWGMLLKPLGHQPRLSNTFLTTIVMYFANLGLPRLGEVVRAGAISNYEGYAVEKVMGTIVVERIFDVISILIVTALALFFASDTIMSFLEQELGDRMGNIGNLFLYLFIGFAVVAGLIFLFRYRIRVSKIGRRITKIAKGFAEGLQTVRGLDRPWWFVFHSVNIWLMYFAMTYLSFFAFGPTAHLAPIAGLIVFVFGGWGIVIPSPGGMGTYHYLAQVALAMYGVNGDDGFSWANISFFSIQLGCNISIGIIALILLPIINRNYKSISAKKKEELALVEE